jgi:hypothetical protein
MLRSEAAFGQQAPLLELQLEAPESCPSRETIVGRVEQLVHDAGAPLRADARLERRNGRWVVEVNFEESKKEVPGDSCAAVAQALVVILAQAIDPTVRDPSPQNPSHEKRGTAQASQPPARPTPNAPAEPGRPHQPQGAETSSGLRQPVEFGASVLLLGEVGSLPAGSTGPSARVRLRVHRWAGELGFSYLLPLWAPAGNRPNVGGYVQWMGGQLGGCYSYGTALQWGGCLASEIGNLMSQAEGAGIEERTEHGLWWAAALSALARARFAEGFAWEIRVELGVPLLRPSFELESYGTIHEPGRASGRLLIGLAWH